MKKSKSVILTISLSLFAIILILILTKNISAFDNFIYSLIMKIKSNKMTEFMKIVTKFGSTSTIIILCLASLSSLYKQYLGSFYLCINMVLSTILNQSLKFIVQRPRPDLSMRLISETGYSFPSGHAMASISFYGFIIFLVLISNLKQKVKNIIVIILSFIILLVGISRIYLGVHYASDVIGGYLLSISLLMITTTVVRKRGLKWEKH